MKTISKYKILGGFPLVLILIVFWTVLIVKNWYKLFNYEVLSNQMHNSVFYLVILFFIFMQLFLLKHLFIDCRYIILKEDYMIFSSVIFPFYKKKIYWQELDKIMFVNEYSNSSNYEAAWLIKNDKLKYRISSFYYSNYKDLIEQMNIKKAGRLKLNPIKQLLCTLGKPIK